MTKNFHERLESNTVELPKDRSVGLVFMGASLLAAVIYRRDESAVIACLVLAAAFGTLALLAPSALRPLNIVWFRLGMLLHKIVNPIVMGVLFYLVVTPFGILMRIGHDPLQARRTAGNKVTHWNARERAGVETGSMRNQF